MTCAIQDLEPQVFVKLNSVHDFVDGFQLAVSEDMTSRQLQVAIKEEGLEVLNPLKQRTPNRFWIQLKSGPFDLVHNLPILKKIADKLRQRPLLGQVLDI